MQLKGKSFVYKGKRYSYDEASEMTGLSPHTIDTRIRQRGWTVDEAMETPYRKTPDRIIKMRNGDYAREQQEKEREKLGFKPVSVLQATTMRW